MPFFQNVFDFEFRPSFIGSDRQYQTGWKIKGNTNRSDYMVSNALDPYNLTASNVLTFNYAYDVNFMNYASLSVTLTGASLAAVTAHEVVNSLNSNVNFSDLFTALVYPSSDINSNSNKVLIKAKKNRAIWRAYIGSTSAETILNFNKNAPVAELPSLFEKYDIQKRFSYPELGSDRLVLLDPANPVDAAIITAAGFNPASPSEDWQLLAGSSDAYWFYKKTYAAGNLTEEIKYPAGAGVGSAAKKTYYGYDGGGNLIKVCETPYVLQSGDLVTP
jgi:hypothetical protein